jgi:outer membrane protein
MKIPVWLALVSSLLTGLPTTATAGAASTGWTVSVGGGLLAGPAFPGSSDYQVQAVPSVRLAYQDVFFASVEEGVGYNLVNTGPWRVTPLLAVDFGRDADGDSLFRVAGDSSTALVGFADIDTTLQAGVRVTRPLGDWQTSLNVRRGLNGHKGLTAEVAMEKASTVTPGQQGGAGRWTLVTGPRASWGDGKYNDAYFGVTPAASAGSGLPVYRAASGLVSAGWGLTMIGSLEGDWSMVGFVRYNRLLGDAADSPLVRQRGSADQLSGGLFLSLRF